MFQNKQGGSLYISKNDKPPCHRCRDVDLYVPRHLELRAQGGAVAGVTVKTLKATLSVYL